MNPVDLVFIALLAIAQPVHGATSYKKFVARHRAGQGGGAIKLYNDVLRAEWIAFGVLLLAWAWLGRPWSGLGIAIPSGSGFWIGAGILLLATGYLVFDWHRAASATEEVREKYRSALGDLAHFMPSTDAEYRRFVSVSFTAGIVEELIYRGYLFWYLGQWLPAWAVVLVSAVIFGAGHSYQGWSGFVRVTAIGIAFGAFYVLTGSIWLPIIAHAVLDILQGATLRRVLGGDEATPDVASAPR